MTALLRCPGTLRRRCRTHQHPGRHQIVQSHFPRPLRPRPIRRNFSDRCAGISTHTSPVSRPRWPEASYWRQSDAAVPVGNGQRHPRSRLPGSAGDSCVSACAGDRRWVRYGAYRSIRSICSNEKSEESSGRCYGRIGSLGHWVLLHVGSAGFAPAGPSDNPREVIAGRRF